MLTYNQTLLSPLPLPVLTLIRPYLDLTAEAYTRGFLAVCTGDNVVAAELVGVTEGLLEGKVRGQC